MKFLLPNKYKKIGKIITPLGFAVWISMQFGIHNKLLPFIFDNNSNSELHSNYINMTITIISFFS